MPLALKPTLRQPASSRDGRDRSPHPYARKGSVSRIRPADCGSLSTAGRDTSVALEENGNENDNDSDVQATTYRASISHTATSESGTEADDENDQPVQLLRALPAPVTRPRKGLRSDPFLDGASTPLLTPAELDRDDRRITKAYFETREGKPSSKKDANLKEEDVLAAKVLFEKRRRAERVRRVCEGALLGAIGLTVISGPGVWHNLWDWHRELLSQVFIVAFVIAIYPLRILLGTFKSVNSSANNGRAIFQRFRIPASFDPATVIYPTFIPVLVALSLLPQFPALLLPNLILGLASLPPRLFPQTSRLADVNTLGWMVAIVPLVVSENTEISSRRPLSLPYRLKVHGPPYLHPEILVLLFPLHQLLLPTLHYLTTTSLLPSEKHMLATGLINLLCFAISPQASIMRALLWIGGMWTLATCTHVLQWNVAIARVPRWRFRPSKSKRNGILEELFFALWNVLSAKRNHQGDDSDADEDGTHVPVRRGTKLLKPQLTLNSFFEANDIQEPASAVEASRMDMLETISNYAGLPGPRKRRHTMPAVDDPTTLFEPPRDRPSKQRRGRLRTWYLELTPEGAVLRKWMYASWVYASIICVVFIPVRMAVSRHALNGAEPVLWALDYVFGDISWACCSPSTVKQTINMYLVHLQHASLQYLSWETFSVPHLRLLVGEANTRLLLAWYWAVVVVIGIGTVTYLSPRIEVDTRRKIFHATIVTMLLPTTFIDPCFCALALGLVLAVFLLLEVIRAGQVPPLGAAIGRFVAPYVDGRDLRGPMVVSHVFLLIGCAIPLWLSLSGLGRAADCRWPGWETENDVRDVAMIAGVVCVGMGDAAASLIGRRYGKRKWPWIGGKSLEGSAAFAVAVTIGLMAAKLWLYLGGWSEEATKLRAEGVAGSPTTYWATQTAKAFLCGCGGSFMEAVLTGANDNVVVPVALWLLVRGVGI